MNEETTIIDAEEPMVVCWMTTDCDLISEKSHV
jgi:hypothetical protein